MIHDFHSGLKGIGDQATSSTYVVLIDHKTMIDALRQHDAVALVDFNTGPFGVVGLTNVKIAGSVGDIANLILVVDVFVEIHRYLGFVDSAHSCGRVRNLIAVRKCFCSRQFIDNCGGNSRARIILDTETREVGARKVHTGMMRLARITLFEEYA